MFTNTCLLPGSFFQEHFNRIFFVTWALGCSRSSSLNQDLKMDCYELSVNFGILDILCLSPKQFPQKVGFTSQKFSAKRTAWPDCEGMTNCFDTRNASLSPDQMVQLNAIPKKMLQVD